MDREISAGSREFGGVLAWIENNLDQRLTLERIANHARLSTYHFSRLFTIHMGRSVMAYVRHLRLIEAAKRIATEPNLKLMELALDSGFESQEAFTRSFKRTFGVSPGRLHLAYHLQLQPEARARHDAPKAGLRVEQLPEPIHRKSFTVAGLLHHYDDGTKLAIPGLRRRLVRILTCAGRVVGETYGVISSERRGDGSFCYMAAAPSEPDELPLPELEKMEIPACTYLVFRITMAAGPAHPQITEALENIWDTLIPESGLSVNETPDFEQYGPDFVPGQAGSVIFYHVPVQLSQGVSVACR
jgi:AraC family transcriptional regulator